MLLLTGPPGSGKTHQILEQVRDAARRGADGVRLLTPTATMAEHLQNELAREGLLLRPDVIQTLHHFIENHAGRARPVSGSVMHFLVRRALADANRPEFRSVAKFDGFQEALGDLIEEFSLAGISPKQLDRLRRDGVFSAEFDDSILDLYRRVDVAVQQRGFTMRGDRLRNAVARFDSGPVAGIATVLLDGFFSFSDLELRLVIALARNAEVTVSLPDWGGSGYTRKRLLRAGFEERTLPVVRQAPRKRHFVASTTDQETEEIARRILAHHRDGRPFREMGVVIRSANSHEAALRATLARFSIPARFYFSEPLHLHPSVLRIRKIIDAVLRGWDFQWDLPALLMSPASESLDRLEFEVRKGLPKTGIECLNSIDVQDPLTGVISRLREIDAWRDEKHPPAEWAGLLASLRKLFPLPLPSDRVDREQVSVWKSHAAALQAYEHAIQAAQEAFENPSEDLTLEEFWNEARTALELTSLRARDRRRNVVHVMDAYEARQWELPVVFVCGLLEKEFPHYNSEHPLLPDSARASLRSSGIQLRTARERDAEERFLWDLATTRATEELTLSYPKFNQKGDENLPSFFLQEYLVAEGVECETGKPLRIRPLQPPALRHMSAIRSAALRERLSADVKHWSASSIESYLQCPFQFFAQRGLSIEEPPAPPDERLDNLLQGSIVHEVLQMVVERSEDWEGLFEETFEKTCRQERIVPGYRTERARLEMLRSLRLFFNENQIPAGGSALTEQDFLIHLDGVPVRGRIDRIDLVDGKTRIVDYKYIRDYKVKDYVKGNDDGSKVQAGLYLLGARDLTGSEPVSMSFCALRRGVRWAGWDAREDLQHLSDLASEQTKKVVAELASGRTGPAPADPDKCDWCPFADACRVEVAVPLAETGGSVS